MLTAYDAIADWYDSRIRDSALLSNPATEILCDLVGDISGQELLDLGCGQGVLTRQLAERGASVTGIDLSEKMLEITRRYEAAEPVSIRYRCDDAQTLATVPDAAFDGVLCCMALMDIPDLDATLQSVARVLRPGGWFAFVVTHPCFQMPPPAAADAERRYFDEGFWRSDNPDGVRGKVGAYHRTLATYLNSLAAAGLRLEKVAEPCPDGRDLPALLAVLCRVP